MSAAELLAALSPIVEALGALGESGMGDLSRAQAALFHNAAQMLVDLEEDLSGDWEDAA